MMGGEIMIIPYIENTVGEYMPTVPNGTGIEVGYNSVGTVYMYYYANSNSMSISGKSYRTCLIYYDSGVRLFFSVRDVSSLLVTRLKLSNQSSGIVNTMTGTTYLTTDSGVNYLYRIFEANMLTHGISWDTLSPINYDNEYSALAVEIWNQIPEVLVPITYMPINSTLSGPDSASSGDTVSVDVSFPDGYIYQESGVSIYNQDGSIPFTYADGKITFTMP